MRDSDWLAGQFESHRGHLRSVAYRMLGNLGEADDAVQEAWLRLHRAGHDGIDNLGGWLTTTVSRVCLDVLRARKTRREVTAEVGGVPGEHGIGKAPEQSESAAAHKAPADPEQEAILADSVGIAMLIVLDSLEPAERVAFVLHDVFGIAFEDIAAIIERSEQAARQLASRARRHLRGEAQVPAAALARQREVVGAFLAASRDGDFDRLLSLLDPQVVFRPDLAARLQGPRQEVRGPAAVAKLFSGRAQAARMALVDGRVGIVVAPRGRLLLVLALIVTEGRISAIEVIAAPERLRALHLAVLPEMEGGSG